MATPASGSSIPVPDSARRAALAAAPALALLGVVVAALLSQPTSPAYSAITGALGLIFGATVLGLGLLDRLGADPGREVIGALGGLWMVAELLTVWLELARKADVGPLALDGGELMVGLRSGIPNLVSVGAAVLVIGWSVRPTGPAVVVAALAAVGLLADTVTGHAGMSWWGPVVVGAHVLCAAWWFGGLTAMVLCVRGRGGWARSLPEFSRLALPTVAILIGCGVIAGIDRLGFGEQWYDSGYGRVLLGKVALLLVLLVLGWRQRVGIPTVARRGVNERVCIRRAVIEIVAQAVVFGLAAALSTLPPG